MSVVGIIGDTHEPVAYPGYLDFCVDTFKYWGCDDYIHIGDIADFHCCSRFPKEHDAPSPNGELNLARRRLALYSKAFGKNLKVCIGNHDRRIFRAGYQVGMPSDALRTLNEILYTKFIWQNSFMIDDVYYSHGEDTGSGKFPALNYALSVGENAVVGHHHTIGGVQFASNKLVNRFGCHTGCGVDQSQAAMRYGAYHKAKAVHGCVVVIDGTPIFEPMPEEYKV